MNIEILNRWTCAVIYKCEAESLGAAALKAIASDADLSDAVLSDADLRRAVLSGADLRRADLSGAVLSDAVGASAPKIENIDAKIIEAITQPGCSLDMGNWHTCETTHCRAGWAIRLAGETGYALEDRIGAAAAGALIYAASRPGVPIPNFYANNDDALADLRKCAGGAA